jgi:RNA polymerase sigma-70 factor (ECF subfamily)
MSLLSLGGNHPDVAGPEPRTGEVYRVSPDFDAVYEEYFKFVWRTVRRLGIDLADTDDIVQEVFVVAHRKLPGFEGRAQVKTWLYKIALGVVRHYFRTQRRKPGHRPAQSPQDLETLRDHRHFGPAEAAERAEAVQILDGILGHLDAEKREVFVLAEIEQLSSVEIAEVLGVNINTIYSRLRTARQEFERALARFQTHEFGGNL